jgi:hypothetical protein
MPALGLLVTYWKPLALLAAVAALMVYRTVIIHERDSARAQVVAMTSQLADFKAAELACEAAVARQNQAVDALKASAEQAVAAARTRETSLAAAAATADARENQRADELMKSPVAADCAGAIRWANAEAAALVKW